MQKEFQLAELGVCVLPVITVGIGIVAVIAIAEAGPPGKVFVICHGCESRRKYLLYGVN